ncbi:MAG: hypothetical protein JW722_03995 [Demequinaceae bacterium]|nr:hypothetical protein [Demequinaceae bacterium]
MRNQPWSDRDLENLFAGRGPTEGELARLVPLVEAVRGVPVSPSEERADSMARVLARVAREGASQAPARLVVKAAGTWKRRLVTIGGVAALATVGVGGAAVASNGAAPGDVLYSIDQAFEAIGIGNGGTAERMDEAARLCDRGDVDQALEHAANALEREGDEQSARALVQAAMEVQNQGAEQSVEVRAQVSEMLQWMGSTDAKGKDFGQGVSERAQAVKDTASHGKSGDAPGQNKDDDGALGDSDGTDVPGNRPSENPGKGPKS